MAASNTTALFVIDIQKEMVGTPDTEIPHAGRMRDAGTAILAAARKSPDRPKLIVFVQHEENPDSGGSLVKGTDPWKLVFEPKSGEPRELLVAKKTGDTFESNPDLADKMKQEGIDTVLAFGIQSEYCVEATCKGALAAGFQVSLLQGAHSTYDTKEKSAVEIEKSVEDRLSGQGASLTRWGDVVRSWTAAQA